MPLILVITPSTPRAQNFEEGSLDSDVFQNLKISIQPRFKARYYSTTMPPLSFSQTIFEKSPFYSHDSLQNFATPKPTADQPTSSSSSSSPAASSSSSDSHETAIRNCYLPRQTTVLKPEVVLPNGSLVYRVDVPLSLSISELTCQVAFFLTVEPIQHTFTSWGAQGSAISSTQPLTLEQELACLQRSGGLLYNPLLTKKAKLNLQLLQPLQCEIQTSQSCGHQFITVQLENMFQRDSVTIHDLNLQLAETFFVPILPQLRTSLAPQLQLSLPNQPASYPSSSSSFSNNNNNNNNTTTNNSASNNPNLPLSMSSSIIGTLFPSLLSSSSEVGGQPVSPSRSPLDAVQFGEATPVNLDSLFITSIQKPSLPLTLMPGDQFSFVVSLQPLPSQKLSVGTGFFKSNVLVSWTTPASFDLINCRRDVIWVNPFYGNQFLLCAQSEETRHDIDVPFVVDFLVSNLSDTPSTLSLLFCEPSSTADAFVNQSLVPLQPITDLGVIPPQSSVSLQIPFVGFERGVHELKNVHLLQHETNRSFDLIHPLTFLIDNSLEPAAEPSHS